MSGVHMFTLLQLPAACFVFIDSSVVNLLPCIRQGSTLVEMSTAMKLQHQWTKIKEVDP